MTQPALDTRTAPTRPAPDPVTDIAEAVLTAALIAVVVAAALPLLIPVAVIRLLPLQTATKTRYWTVPRGWPALVAPGPVAVTVLLTAEIHAGVALAGRLPARLPLPDRLEILWDAAWPWLAVNLAVGILLLPAAHALHRRRIAALVRHRRIPDVLVQEDIERARKHAADLAAATRIGVTIDPRTGAVRTVHPGAVHAPHRTGHGIAFGAVAAPTIRSLPERLADRRRIRHWITPDHRWVTLPADPGAVRAVVVAESGAGKTVLLHGIINAALTAGWPVVVIDGKGDPADAQLLAATGRAAGHTVTVAPAWNLFTGRPDQIVDKLMRLLPPPDGANQHYLDEARAILAAIQTRTPLTSLPDLQTRLGNPLPHIADRDRDLVTAIVEPRTGLTAAGRVARAVLTAARPLEHALDQSGWNYRTLTHDLTVVPLAAADTGQARLGDLQLLDLRHALTDRLAAGDRRPLLVVVDEFAQLVGADTDPGDTAAALFETARSAGIGLILSAQSTAGLARDDTRRARALASGAALILGRSKDPEDAVRHAGTAMRQESSGAAAGEELRSARAQHAWVIPPQDVREAWDGTFWLIQTGAIAPFRALPATSQPIGTPDPGAASDAPTARPAVLPSPAPAADQPAPTTASDTAAPAPTGPTPPAPRVTRRAGPRSTRTSPPIRPITPPSTEDGPITGLEIEVRHLGDHQWVATAYPATDTVILNDAPEPATAVFTSTQYPPQARFGAWNDQWHPHFFTRFNPDADPLPTSWTVVLTELVDTARRRYRL